MKTLLLASKAKDNIYENGVFIKSEEAGPAFYLSKQLDRLRHPHTLAENIPAEVNIFVNSGKETGEIIKKDKIHIPDNLIAHENCIVSTIAPDALELSKLKRFTGTVFLDIQGFLRGTTEETTPLLRTLCKFKCFKYIKGTTEEIKTLLKVVNYPLPNNAIIIETRGEKEVVIHEHGKKTVCGIKNAVNVPNTIGAGDTFLASFVHYTLVKQEDTEHTVKEAIGDACAFLTRKIQSGQI